MYLIIVVIVWSVLMVGTAHGNVQPVFDGTTQTPDGTLQIHGGEDQTLTVTCSSDISTLYLEYKDVQYNDSVLTNGSYSVNFTVQATREDDGGNVTCYSVNSTSGEVFWSWAAIYLKLKPTNVYDTGGGIYQEGENITITCHADGSRPAANFPQFLFGINSVNQSEIQVTFDYDNTTDTYNTTATWSLTVNRSSNGKSISCQVVVDTIIFYTKFIWELITVHYGPDSENVWMSGPETGNEGSTVTYKCELGLAASTAMNPAPTFFWFNGTDAINTTSQPVIKKKQTSGFDTGSYYLAYQEWTFELSRYNKGSEIQCVVMGTGNRSVTKAINITDVYYKPVIEVTGAPLIDPDTGHYIYDEGDTVNLTCNLLEANPPTNVSWIHQSSSGSSVSFIKEDLKARNNKDTYQCSGTNRVGSTFSVIRLFVQYGPNIENGYRKIAEEGDNVTVSCNVDSNPPAKVWWQKKGDNSFSMDGHTLTLIDVTRENGGDYICVASSNRTRENGIIEVVTANKTFPIDVQYGPGNSIRLSPNITSLEVTHGSLVPLVKCLADCNPPCTIYWSRSGSGKDLTIGTARKEYHFGEYICTAYNHVLNTKYKTNTSLVLYVSYRPEMEPVSIDDVNWYEEGAPIEVTCKVTSFPQPNITWYRYGEDVITSGNYTVNTEVNCLYQCETTSTLTVAHAECLESGSFYTCHADNGIVWPTSRTTLDKMKVKCHPRLVNSSFSINNFTLKLRDTINMTASFLSIPGPTVKWLFRATSLLENKTVLTDDWHTDWDQLYFTSVYTIDSLRMDQFGQYLVVADNGNQIKSYAIYNIELNREGFPHKPHDLVVSCSKTAANFSWSSPYNGGYNQTFSTKYGYFNPPVIKGPSGVLDPGENSTVMVTIQLEDVHTFYFTVKAVNQYGETEANEVVGCMTVEEGKGPGKQTSSSDKGGIIAGAAIGSLLFVAVLIFVGFFIYRRHKLQQGNVKFADLHLSFYNKN